jgi:hypothetical protein
MLLVVVQVAGGVVTAVLVIEFQRPGFVDAVGQGAAQAQVLVFTICCFQGRGRTFTNSGAASKIRFAVRQTIFLAIVKRLCHVDKLEFVYCGRLKIWILD